MLDSDMHDSDSDILMALVDHVEIDHERELVSQSLDEVWKLHLDMHHRRSDWDHTHRRDGR